MADAVASAQVTPPLPDSPSPRASTSSPINVGQKRKSTLFNILRRTSVVEETTPPPRRQSVFDIMEREKLQKAQEPHALGGLEEDDEDDSHLPQVQLIPPEDEGDAVVLYPFPNYPPPTLALDNQSPPETPERNYNPHAPTTSSPLSSRPRPQSVATAPKPRPSSTFSNNPAWNGMAEGFNLPTAKFSRVGAGPTNSRSRQSVIMPKTKTQVVEERKKRMSQVMEWDMAGGAHGGVGRPVMHREGSSRPVRRDSEDVIRESAENVETLSEEPDMLEPVSKATTTPSSPTAPGPPVLFPLSAPEPQRSNSTPMPMPVEGTPRSSISSPRRSRTMSLSGAFPVPLWASSSKTESPISTTAPPLPPMPSVPTDQPRKVPRKQKSLKNLFFSSSTPPETVTAEPKADVKEKKSLNKQRSKPDLRIDTNATRPIASLNSAPVLSGNRLSSATPPTPALSTGRSESFYSIPGTPSSATTIVPSPIEGKKPKLTKKFSLSNMSVFKKRSNSAPASDGHSLAGASRDSFVGDGEGEVVPMVPALPEVYKKEKEAKRSKSEIFTARDRFVNVPPAPSVAPAAPTEVSSPGTITPSRVMSPISAISVYQTPSSNIEPATYESTVVQSPTDSISTLDPSSKSISSISDVDVEEDILDAQFMQLPSPKERDASQDFHKILANAPGRRSEVVVVQEGRRSLEALVVLGPGSVRPNVSPSLLNNRLSASDSEASMSSFASCASSDSSLARTIQADHTRRGSAESEDSQEDEGLVTPICHSVETFGAGVRERKESGSGESGESGEFGMMDEEAEDTARGMGVRKFQSSRKLRPSPPPGSCFAPPESPSIAQVTSSGPPPNRPLPPAPGQIVEEKKIGSLDFDTLGLNFGNWDEREEMAGRA
ncbi:hypothetical protein L198_00484 [Cryptococcus wingfieldii CBS 7118]|uniref:Uncharacterized protein n=1 Tax=Cryptococcus wingfieldii CBS 7118 TaxID=1295528 RepID=A0A1E3K6Q7_9TREE|nr:hypothetical protein L198_00484 [Cryptococcus wingfieldii CBS 7118]ODO08751.1 hypothetical protein L198_00484 [Cryptococcus wingfieldii CBS 7118]